jgi:alpha-N-arabinofuranosidase
VGTWRTSARYRKLKVTSLDGKVLFEGTPRLPSDSNVANGWRAYGKGRFQWTQDSPLNCDYCQLIEPDEGEAGVQQTPFCIRSGEKYHGSLWARGKAKGLAVRLLDGEKKLAEADLPAPKADWQEFKFTLAPSAAADDATLQVGVKDKGEVWIDQVSLMSESAKKAGGFRPDLLKAIADLRPPIIRWPGGCFASFYRWKDGVGPQHKRVKYPRSIWDDQDVNSFGTDEFLAMCRRVGAEPLIVINLGMHDARQKRDAYCQEARDWVEYCNGPATSKWGKVRAANGHPKPYGIKYWEIDNEIWRLQPDDYANVVKQFVPAMKKVDPKIITIACGSGQLGRIWGKGDEAVIAKCADIVEYLSVHHYESPNRYATGPAAAEKFWRGLGDRIAKCSNPKLKVYVSEWNAQSTDWRTGLYCGGILNVFERCGDFLTLAGPALFLRHASARSWDNAFINFDHRRWFPAPNYVVMKLWRDHYAPKRLAVEGDLAGLSAVATKSADGKTIYVKAVNATGKAATLTVEIKGDFAPGKVSMQIIAPDSLSARNSLDSPNAISPAKGKASRSGSKIRIELPRWSAGAATVGRK